MNFIKTITVSLLISACSLIHADEIIHGTLKNGMHYYLCPDPSSEEKTVTISLIIKKPNQLAFLPMEYKFFFWQNKSLFSSISCISYPKMTFFYAQVDSSLLNDGLLYYSTRLKNSSLPDRVIEDLRKEHQKDREEDLADLGAEAVETNSRLTHLAYGYTATDVDTFFTQSNDLINATYQTLLNPSLMALVIDGAFDPIELERQLELLFDESLKITPLEPTDVFESNTPFYVPCKIITEIDDEGNAISSLPVYFYVYHFEPSLRNYILNNLAAIFYGSEELRVPNPHLNPMELVSLHEIKNEPIDPIKFEQVKEELKITLLEDEPSSFERSVHHFLYSDSLEQTTEDYLSELDTITPEKFQTFIQQEIASAKHLDL